MAINLRLRFVRGNLCQRIECISNIRKVHINYNVRCLMLFALLSGCTRSQSVWIMRGPTAKPAVLKNVTKVAVVSLQADPETSQRLESDMVTNLKQQGIQAVSIHELFQRPSAYSGQNILTRLQSARIDTLLNLTYSGPVGKDFAPALIRYKVYSIRELKTQTASNNYGTLNTALIALMKTLPGQ